MLPSRNLSTLSSLVLKSLDHNSRVALSSCVINSCYRPSLNYSKKNNSNQALPSTIRRIVIDRRNLSKSGKKFFNWFDLVMRREQKKKDRHPRERFEGTHEEILHAEIGLLLRQNAQEVPVSSSATESSSESPEEPPQTVKSLPEKFSEHPIKITSLSSTGDGLGYLVDPKTHEPLSTDRIYVVPFTLPGDVIRSKIITHHTSPSYSQADFLHVIHSSPDRDDSLVRCRYFAICSGCQLQSAPYRYQLSHKASVLRHAYARFSGLPASQIPEIGDATASPLQYGYRTKLTPHFDGPQGGKMARKNGKEVRWEKVPPIGFNVRAGKWILDVEECPIGTEAVQKGLIRERKRVARDIQSYKRGATVLLRESTRRVPDGDSDDESIAKRRKLDPELQDEKPKEEINEDEPEDESTVYEKHDGFIDIKTCTSDQRGMSTEYVDGFVFRNRANSFFQNNNAILPTFISYIRDRALGTPQSSSSSPHGIENLIDAYCGSGLFSITLSSLFRRTIGVDIDEHAISAARENLRLNNLSLRGREAEAGAEGKRPRSVSPEQSGDPNDQTERSPQDTQNNTQNEAPPSMDETQISSVEVHTAPAARVFDPALEQKFDPGRTVVVIDPPRKGCDRDFLEQLMDFAPRRIVYVACNVFTQARDVGVLVDGGDIESTAHSSRDKRGEHEQIPREQGVSAEPTEENTANRRNVESVAESKKTKYAIESLQAFDFFPQTAHVEGVAILQRVD